MKEERHHLEQLSARVKEELPQFMEQQFGHLEQQPPHRPSFLLVVVLFGATIIVAFIIAMLVLHLGSGAFSGHAFRKHPTSQLVQPPLPAVPVRWTA